MWISRADSPFIDMITTPGVYCRNRRFEPECSDSYPYLYMPPTYLGKKGQKQKMPLRLQAKGQNLRCGNFGKSPLQSQGSQRTDGV